MADTLSTERVDQHGNSRRRQGVDKVVFGVAAGLALVFLLYGALDSEGFGETGGSILTWITTNFGWFFVLTSGAFLLFSVFLAATRYGNIKLGADDSVPEFSTFSWVSMMFATGMGIGLMFYGVAEPLTHLNAPPMGMAEPGSEEAAHLAMEYTFFHWGFHPWAMYAVIGLVDRLLRLPQGWRQPHQRRLPAPPR
jgi:glycine betaine transporter